MVMQLLMEHRARCKQPKGKYHYSTTRRQQAMEVVTPVGMALRAHANKPSAKAGAVKVGGWAGREPRSSDVAAVKVCYASRPKTARA